MRKYSKSFVKNGRRYFVPLLAAASWDEPEQRAMARKLGNAEWSQLKARIDKRFVRHRCFKTFEKGGHISALRPHVGREWFATIDLADFYDHVTRTKVFRSLRAIGFTRDEAYRIAGQSTVQQDLKCVLPRGFRQSSLLASVVLQQSLFGSYVRRLPPDHPCWITVYCDDIVMSSDSKQSLEDEYAHVTALLERSGFAISNIKSQRPARTVSVFNINLSQTGLSFTDQRMWSFFKKAHLLGEKNVLHEVSYPSLFGLYVSSVNAQQDELLRIGLQRYTMGVEA